MKNNKAFGKIIAALAVVVLAGPAQAGIITTGINANNTASTTDLLQTSLSSAVLTGSWNEGVAGVYGGGLLNVATPLYDGLAVVNTIYNPDTHGNPPQSDYDKWLITGNNNRSVVTFTLNTTGAKSLGYNITQIDFFHGWGDDGRDGMKFKIQYSTVADPGTFIDYATSTYFDPASSYGISRITDSTGTIATGVAALRFSTPTVDNNWGGISEIDVIGSAPSGTPYDTWKALTSFTNLPFTDNAPTSDPDGDGLTNQQEFAFGQDPTTGSSANPITDTSALHGGQFSYTRWDASGLRYKVWTSPDLQTWTMDDSASQIDGALVGEIRTVNVTLTVSPPSGTRLFVRVAAD